MPVNIKTNEQKQTEYNKQTEKRSGETNNSNKK